MNGSTLLMNLGLAAASLVVVFGIAEASLTVRDWRWRARFDDLYQRRLLCTTASDNPRLLYTMRPGSCSANSRGYPDTEHSVTKPGGVFRVVVIGDSIGAGQGVERSERFASLLPQILDDGLVEVIVLARPGYSTGQELVILESEAFSYQPDLVIWAYCLNDPADPVYHDANGELGRYYFRPRSYTVHYFRKMLFRARENWVKRDCGNEYHVILHCVYRDSIEANIAAIGSLAKAHKVPILFTIMPLFDRDLAPLESIHHDLSARAQEAGLVPVDLLRRFHDVQPGTYAQTAPGGLDPWHPNPAGHALIAEDLAGEIRPFLGPSARAMPGLPDGVRPRSIP